MLRTATFMISACISGGVVAHEIGHEHEHVEGGWNAEAGFVSDVDIEARLWNPRGKTQEEIDARAEYLVQFFDAGRTAEERAADDEIKERYAGYTDGIGKQIIDGRETFESLEQYILQQGDPAFKSGRQEMLESILHSYV